MNWKLSFFIFLLIPFNFASFSQSGAKDITGTWNYYAPYAPEGYQNGVIIVGSGGNQKSVFLSFQNSDSPVPANNVKITGDSLEFSIFFQGDSVDVLLKLQSDTVMTGKAVSPEGETDLSLKRKLKYH
jgi:hypothetical protein